MGKLRVYELAKTANMATKDMLNLLLEMGFEVKSNFSVLEDDQVEAAQAMLAKAAAGTASSSGKLGGAEKANGKPKAVSKAEAAPARDEELPAKAAAHPPKAAPAVPEPAKAAAKPAAPGASNAPKVTIRPAAPKPAEPAPAEPAASHEAARPPAAPAASAPASTPSTSPTPAAPTARPAAGPAGTPPRVTIRPPQPLPPPTVAPGAPPKVIIRPRTEPPARPAEPAPGSAAAAAPAGSVAASGGTPQVSIRPATPGAPGPTAAPGRPAGQPGGAQPAVAGPAAGTPVAPRPGTPGAPGSSHAGTPARPGGPQAPGRPTPFAPLPPPAPVTSRPPQLRPPAPQFTRRAMPGPGMPTRPGAAPAGQRPGQAPAQPAAGQQPAAAAGAPGAAPARPAGAPGAAPGAPGLPGRGRPGDRGGRDRKEEKREAESFQKLQAKSHKEREAAEAVAAKAAAGPLKLSGSITVKELAEKMGVKQADLIKKLFLKGIMATINQSLELETAEMIAVEYGFTVEFVEPTPEGEDIEEEIDDPAKLKARPPVVTIMGHVDHGKTSLLDAIRKTNVTAGEAGGITQHIGAYQVHINSKDITFLDTPGHEAFTSMRARGANATDVSVRVVVAGDGVKPQTIESINHAKAANVPIVVAINKIDKPGANPDQVKQQLTEHGLVAEEWGGTTVMVPVSAKQKVGLESLLEMILLVAEVQELKANPDRNAKGLIIEAQLDKGMGPVATVLVQTGTLRVGDNFVVGGIAGKVRAMINDHGRRIKEAGPAMPVEVLGMPAVPKAGDVFQVVDDERTAKTIAQQRADFERTQKLQQTRKISLDNLYDHIQAGKIKDLKVILKADVKGSSEALEQALNNIKQEGVNLKVIHSGTGDITEADVMLAAASDALIIGFNAKADERAKTKAEAEKVDIRSYSIIYKVIEDMEAALKGMLEPVYEEVFQGRAEVRAIFKVGKTGAIAGCYVKDGKVVRNAQARVLRNDAKIFEGKLSSLKRFKDDAKEVATGYECGIAFEGFNDLQEGDVIECFTMEVKQ